MATNLIITFSVIQLWQMVKDSMLYLCGKIALKSKFNLNVQPSPLVAPLPWSSPPLLPFLFNVGLPTLRREVLILQENLKPDPAA